MIMRQTADGRREEVEPRCTVWTRATLDRCIEECRGCSEVGGWDELRANLASCGVCIMEGEE